MSKWRCVKTEMRHIDDNQTLRICVKKIKIKMEMCQNEDVAKVELRQGGHSWRMVGMQHTTERLELDYLSRQGVEAATFKSFSGGLF